MKTTVKRIEPQTLAQVRENVAKAQAYYDSNEAKAKAKAATSRLIYQIKRK
jgi:hypothetical protein